MAIAKRPKGNQDDINNFIAGGAGKPIVKEVESAPKAERVAAIVRFKPDMLREIDAAAHRLGISRAAWIQIAARKSLDAGQ